MFYSASRKVASSPRSEAGGPGRVAALLRGLAVAAHEGFAANPLLMLVGTGMLVAFVGTLTGMALDPRIITGVPAWLKPAKFAISISIYSFTLLWLLTFVQGHTRLKTTVAGLTAAGFLIEMLIIVGQVMRGTTSHFNVSTPLDAALFAIMGVTIVIVWSMSILMAGMLVRQKISDGAFALSLRMGIIVAVAGMAVAFLMTQPTGTQIAAAQVGQGMPLLGAHSVGLADGGPGIPFLGWSTVGGDLRIPHFVGLHALQVLPFVGWLLSRRRFAPLGNGRRKALVLTFSLSYMGVLLLLTWQALRGQSIVAPDGQTLQAFAALLSATALGVLAVAAHARLRPGLQPQRQG
ncbi:MAG: hypothetical protein M3014_12215 [Chloroflexota bacterium]|nr:hypothetical protein [Chloroflexota bacterium]